MQTPATRYLQEAENCRDFMLRNLVQAMDCEDTRHACRVAQANAQRAEALAHEITSS